MGTGAREVREELKVKRRDVVGRRLTGGGGEGARREDVGRGLRGRCMRALTSGSGAVWNMNEMSTAADQDLGILSESTQPTG